MPLAFEENITNLKQMQIKRQKTFKMILFHSMTISKKLLVIRYNIPGKYIYIKSNNHIVSTYHKTLY